MTKPCNEYTGLLVGFVDKELTPEETAQVNDHIGRCSSCREEYRRLQAHQDKIESLRFAEPHERVLRNLWRSPYSRLVRNTGLALVLVGWLTLVVMGLIAYLQSSSESALGKTAMAGIIIGFLILLASAVRERIRSFKTDPYKEIEK